MLVRLVKIRTSETWNLLSESDFFKYCTATQKTWLESIFIPIEYKTGGVLAREGDAIDFIYIIREGSVQVTRQGKQIAVLGRGDFVGTMQEMQKDIPSNYGFSHTGPLLAFAMKKQDILKFAKHNPGILMKQVYNF
jgi:CRP-like cAMP-binding protein